LFCVEHAEEITAGKCGFSKLSARALDDFTFQVDLRAPAPSFPQLISNRIFCAVPRRAIEASGPSWTEPGRMVSSGALGSANDVQTSTFFSHGTDTTTKRISRRFPNSSSLP
jgi:ABC-type oligopeptide transport system substrate-binding subunit